MQAFAEGCDGHLVAHGSRDRYASGHAVMGNWPVASALVAEFAAEHTPFWYLDSAYIQGTGTRCLRVERSRFWPVSRVTRTMDRARALGVKLQPWRHTGRHVLICLHAMKFGRPWGIDIAAWQGVIEARIRAVTDRPIIVRRKPVSARAKRDNPLASQLEDAWCVVTHSSTVAVTAAIQGIPVFCEPTCAAAPVGCTDFAMIEQPRRPDREQWIADLAWRQWSREEMRNGEAWCHIRHE
jgi:hypothetical protein